MVRRLFVYVTDNDMDNYLLNKSHRSYKYANYRKNLANFYQNGGLFVCNANIPHDFLAKASKSQPNNDLIFVVANKLFSKSIATTCSSFATGNPNCHISIFEAFPSMTSIGTWDVDCYYWDLKERAYLPLEGASTNNGSLKTASYHERLIKDPQLERIVFVRQIRDWLLLNTKCSATVYIDKEYIIYSDGDISINPDVKDIPEYIKFASL